LENNRLRDKNRAMKKQYLALTCLVACLLRPAQFSFAAPSPQIPSKIRVMIFTGGHEFEREPFEKLFKDNPEIACRWAEHPNAQALLKAEAAKDYDVLLLYDMYQEISDEAKADFVARLKEGKGLVVLHHAIASYQNWPEYRKIIGARYYLEKTMVDGVEKPRSAYKHDMHFKIQVADRDHPITRGLNDYEIHDETYKWFDVARECHPLLVTDEPESNRVIAWTRNYEGARVVYIQSGHDHFAYENPNFQLLLKQAIRWAANRN
jgi:type 1 glutamine amidotransferase